MKTLNLPASSRICMRVGSAFDLGDNGGVSADPAKMILLWVTFVILPMRNQAHTAQMWYLAQLNNIAVASWTLISFKDCLFSGCQ